MPARSDAAPYPRARQQNPAAAGTASRDGAALLDIQQGPVAAPRHRVPVA